MQLFVRESLPSLEHERQRAVDALPDQTGRSPELDQIAAAAATLCDVPTGLVSIVDRETMLIPGRFNSRLRNMLRADTVCGQAILHPDEVLCVPDLLLDPRYAGLSVAQAPEPLRFYAGAPIVSLDGHAIGMVCALGLEPRPAITRDQRRALARLAKLALLHLGRMPIQRGYKVRPV